MVGARVVMNVYFLQLVVRAHCKGHFVLGDCFYSALALCVQLCSACISCLGEFGWRLGPAYAVGRDILWIFA